MIDFIKEYRESYIKQQPKIEYVYSENICKLAVENNIMEFKDGNYYFQGNIVHISQYIPDDAIIEVDVDKVFNVPYRLGDLIKEN